MAFHGTHLALLVGCLVAGLAPAAQPARAATGSRLPLVSTLFDPTDVWGGPEHPGPTFLVAATTSLKVIQETALNFGTVAAPTSGSASLTLVPATDVLTYASTGGLLSGGAYTRGVYAISGGGAHKAYTVTVPASVSAEGFVVTFDYYTLTDRSTSAGTLTASGTDTLYLGGNVSVPSTAPVGALNDNVGTLEISSNGNIATTEVSNVQLTIAKPLSLTKTSDLNFGDVVPGATAGTVVLSTARARSVTGGVTLGNALAVSVGGFSLDGAAQAEYNLTVSPATLSLTGPGTAMTVGSWTLAPSSPATLPAAPPQAIEVGATLHVGASQKAGSYTGLFTLTAAYQ